MSSEPETLALAIDQVSNTMRHWGISARVRSELLDVSPSTLKRWESNAPLRRFTGRMTQDQLLRISYLLGIQKALRQTFTDPDVQAEWITSSNAHPTFAGRTPIDLARSGHIGLRRVRQHLDAACGF